MAENYGTYIKKLDENIHFSGMDDELKKAVNREYALKMKENYWSEYPDSTRDEADFFIKQMTIRKILKEDLIWLMRWMSDPTRIEEVHQTAYDFFRYGPDVLPKEYLDSIDQNGHFQWNANATRELILIPRGVGKTTVFHCGRAIHNIINHPDYKWLMVHSDKKRVLGNLKQTTSFMYNGKLALIFPHIFAENDKEYLSRGSKITQEKANIVRIQDADGIKPDFDRKEDTITLGAPGVSRTGWHFEGALADDLVTKETSYSEEVSTQIMEYVDELEGLEEYHQGENFKIWMTGTQWYEKNAYTKMVGRKDTSIFQLPAAWNASKGRMFVSKFLDDEKLERKIRAANMWGESQYLMIPRKFSGANDSIGFDKDRDVIYDTEGKKIEELKETCLHVQVCDPSYATKDKKEGDGKSRFTISHFFCDATTTYLYAGYSSMGESLDAVEALNAEHAERFDTDFFIQDAQGGAQGALFDSTERYIKTFIPWLRSYKISASSVTGTPGKIAVAMEVLSNLFKNSTFKVIVSEEHRQFTDLAVRQLQRRDKGYDIIDTCVYCIAGLDNNQYDRENEVNTGVYRRRLKLRKKKKPQNKLLAGFFRGMS